MILSDLLRQNSHNVYYKKWTYKFQQSQKWFCFFCLSIKVAARILLRVFPSPRLLSFSSFLFA